MAKCEDCGQEMLTANGCTFNYLELRNKKRYHRLRVGNEGWVESGERCPDCGAKYGYYHHLGCDVERCPVCGDQQIGCACDIVYLLKIPE